MSIGQRIVHLRTQKRISQGDIERSTGMQRTYISRVERGHTVTSVETLQRFAGALDVPLYRLFYTAQDDRAAGAKPAATLEELARAAGAEGTDARFLLQLKSLVGKIVESDRALLFDCARKLAGR
jgi:transcriptional regulator with XRE-family HTH domain